ncbi:O-methyltransferase [Algoriphagus sediminis]|uniref:Class I SAM-dependent methyltransferase n=1 Tax=Algoriphagus sediminis TaxID=3057113 RepID=A0ABT7Y8U1_9BACT|nr:class I SAM-dependent methyltransferase [Algoriphagus sediminis]MDN3202943.1 class I SAM-dependent methyltransferase [Algoriphagus sediminis]
MKDILRLPLDLSRKFVKGKELKSISGFDNPTLRAVHKAMLSTLDKGGSEKDLEAFERCEKYRRTLLNDETEVSLDVFEKGKTRVIRDICASDSSPKGWAKFLYYLAKAVKNPTILEIGTNVGISGSYLLESIKGGKGKLISLEGIPELCELSSKQFSGIVDSSRFEVIQGLYDKTFDPLIERKIPFNLAFIDGNHRMEPTLHYLEALKPIIADPAILVFDDIYWTDEMKETWEIIKKDPIVNFSIDLRRQGIVIIDKNEAIHNQNFKFQLFA